LDFVNFLRENCAAIVILLRVCTYIVFAVTQFHLVYFN
jgi:hypothetical protein